MKNKVFLALGTNVGNRHQNLVDAVNQLEKNNIKFIRSSPIYRVPALTLNGAPLEYNRPFFNCVIQVETNKTPQELILTTQEIERKMGSTHVIGFAPRLIDIDIVKYNDEYINEVILKDSQNIELVIPHRGLNDRQFLWDALASLGEMGSCYGGKHISEIMGIINITQDSFSKDGIVYDMEMFKKIFEHYVDECVNCIDIGAESTNPNSIAMNEDLELERLLPIFEYIKSRKKTPFDPKLSIDTYKPEIARIAIEAGFEIINDVNGLRDERMIDLLIEYPHIKYVLTHSLTVPADKNIVLKDDKLFWELERFLSEKLALCKARGVDLSRIYLDVGIGFGKHAYGSLELLKQITVFQKYGSKILIGHSRKSFFNLFESTTKTIDTDTLAMSIALSPNVDIIRTHTPIEHLNAILVFNTMQG